MPDALKEWQSLDGGIKEPLRKALEKRLNHPHAPGARLREDLSGCYKIKLRKQGYRLVYTEQDMALVVLVLSIDRRDDMVVYRSAIDRLLGAR
ncbi:MAG: type II toxin-antitoxin system RelE/ParE family toxin [Alphaproteobacteria bacterium]